jgi:hypothetical protein
MDNFCGNLQVVKVVLLVLNKAESQKAAMTSNNELGNVENAELVILAI